LLYGDIEEDIYLMSTLCHTEQHMKKLNWSCTSCGMSSSRRSSVLRHIDNGNIHNGIGQAVPFVEYSVGRRRGIYRPQQVPRFKSSMRPLLVRLVDKITLELENEIAKEVAKRICQKNVAWAYDIIESSATNSLWFKNFKEVFGQPRV